MAPSACRLDGAGSGGSYGEPTDAVVWRGAHVHDRAAQHRRRRLRIELNARRRDDRAREAVEQRVLLIEQRDRRLARTVGKDGEVLEALLESLRNGHFGMAGFHRCESCGRAVRWIRHMNGNVRAAAAEWCRTLAPVEIEAAVVAGIAVVPRGLASDDDGGGDNSDSNTHAQRRCKRCARRQGPVLVCARTIRSRQGCRFFASGPQWRRAVAFGHARC